MSNTRVTATEVREREREFEVKWKRETAVFLEKLLKRMQELHDEHTRTD